MTRTVSAEVRSRIMSKVPYRDTVPERIVRSLLHRSGFRFRIHDRGLPGRPDIVLPRYRIAVFVHGCFWHQHSGCPKSRRPSTNIEFWNRKLDGNASRDERKIAQLKDLGWRVIVLWECEIKRDPNACILKIITMVESSRRE
jgi:DNA mismatch endonuclease, patch repair protein